MMTLKRILPLLLLVSGLVVSIVLSIPAEAGTGGGGTYVVNVPPTFRYIELDIQSDAVFLELALIDTNGAWGTNGDIMRVKVELFDQQGEILASMSYQQYTNASSSLTVDRFTNELGSALKEGQCNVSHPSTDPEKNSNVELAKSEMDLVFAMDKLDDGHRIRITVYDRIGSYSQVNIPYSEESSYFLSTQSESAQLAAAAVSALIAGSATMYISFIKPK